MFFKNNLTKSCQDSMLELTGYEIWPPTHGNPTIKCSQPRIITKRQKGAMEAAKRKR